MGKEVTVTIKKLDNTSLNTRIEEGGFLAANYYDT